MICFGSALAYLQDSKLYGLDMMLTVRGEGRFIRPFFCDSLIVTIL